MSRSARHLLSSTELASLCITAATCAAAGKGELQSVRRILIRRDIPVCVSIDCLWHQAARRPRRPNPDGVAFRYCCDNLTVLRLMIVLRGCRSEGWTAAEQSRDHALGLARLSTSCAAIGKPEQAGGVAGDLVNLAGGLVSARVATPVSDLRAPPWPLRGDTGVADLLRKLDTLRLS
jgi:hypothetical protein